MARINKDDLKIGITFTRCRDCERVEVVRCKDCYKIATEDCPMDYGWTSNNIFCSYGERRIEDV